MKTYFFTFGQTHVHSVNGFTFDKDVVVQISAIDSNTARQKMFDHFGDKWAFEYINKPNMHYFPRGIKELL